MAQSKLLKEAIADARAVKETAIANAKIALEEAFTPRLQSILSKKLQQEIEGEEEETELEEEYGAEDAPTGDSTKIGAGDGKQPSGITTDAHTKLDPETTKISAKVGTEDDNVDVVSEGEGDDENLDGVIDDPTGASVTEDEEFGDDEFDVTAGDGGEGEEEFDQDELDLEAIIKELEGEFGDEESSEEDEFSADAMGGGESPVPAQIDAEEPVEEDDEFGGEEFPAEEEPAMATGPSGEEEVDLDEILREMGYGDDEEEVPAGDEPVSADAFAEKEEELQEAYKVIKQMRKTINEVNLLNAKLLYSNKLFKSYDMNNQQKMKVIETFDRTHTVREVKLVFATLAESLKVGNAKKVQKARVVESFASNVVKSTAPKKQIISESNAMAERFKKLAGLKG